MKTALPTVFCAALFSLLALGLPACKSATKSGNSDPSGKKGLQDDLRGDVEKASANLDELLAGGSYYEVLHDGRIYVLGTEEAKENLESKGQEPPYQLTMIGAGPAGETVKIEISKDDAEFQERLKAAFNAKHGLDN